MNRIRALLLAPLLATETAQAADPRETRPAARIPGSGKVKRL